VTAVADATYLCFGDGGDCCGDGEEEEERVGWVPRKYRGIRSDGIPRVNIIQVKKRPESKRGRKGLHASFIHQLAYKRFPHSSSDSCFRTENQ
jgi:hypothetical protein